MTNKKHILFLNKVDTLNLSTKDLKVSCEPLIKTIPLEPDSHLWNKNIPWIITSKTAADLILCENLPKVMYAIGSKTAQKFPSAIYPTTATAKALAKLIIDKDEKEVLFVCGSKEEMNYLSF